jgi:hypothetical protein
MKEGKYLLPDYKVACSLPHVRRWLNRWNELQDNVSDANYTNDRANNVLEDVEVEAHSANEEVDWDALLEKSRYIGNCNTYKHHVRGRRTGMRRIWILEVGFGTLGRVSILDPTLVGVESKVG